MAIKALNNIKHDGISYESGDIITKITKDEAFRLVKLEVAEIIDNKFDESKEKIKNKILTQKRINKKKEEEFIYAKS